MVEIIGINGLRPEPKRVATVTAPPYDVIKPGTKLEKLLFDRRESIVHVTLGKDPLGNLARLKIEGALIADAEPCFYIYEQTWQGGKRLGLLAAVEVSDYSQKKIRRHEKTFASKVQGRLKLAKDTGLTLGPCFLLSPRRLTDTLAKIVQSTLPVYAFTTDLANENDLSGIANRIVRVPQTSADGKALAALIADQPLYIADGHHRYHAALLGNQTHMMAYITDGAQIQAYNRVINGRVPFAEAAAKLELTPCPAFATPKKHEFCIYHRGKAWTLKAKTVPEHVVGRLDCSILERELYPHLGVGHELIMDEKHFDYYPERDLATMVRVVDSGRFDIAVALHPVATEELMAVADAGLDDPEIVMPEKSTFFAPKVLTGIVLYQHRYR